MAPDRPLFTIAVALAVVAGLVWPAAAPRGALAPEHVGDAFPAADDGEPDEHLPATGEPDGLTVVDPGDVVDLTESGLDREGGVATEVAYPVVPNADPLSDFLERELSAEVDAFETANPGAVSFESAWNLTAANDDIVGVRVTREETDSEGTREGYTTYWYDSLTGTTHPSTALVAGQEELEELNGLVRDALPEAAAPDAVHPISSLYDSVGFNPDGDLVVEFDAGQVSPVGEGRTHAVVDASESGPLLSDLGERASHAATRGVRDFAVADPPEAVEDGREPTPPGTVSAVDEDVDCSDPDTKCVALTYDDGPGGRTPELLDMLAEYDARATFFVTGHPVMEDPRTVRRTYAEGHELANHTLNHPDLAGLGAGGIRSDLDIVQALVYRETGYTMDLMRPPYGSTDEEVASVTADLGLAQILWSIDTNDWKDRKASVVADRAVDGASPGAIILMHDIHGTTIDASRTIIRELDASGYTMVTVTQLLGTTTPGETYVDGAPEPPAPTDGEGGAGTGDETV
ncbi:polysaccharide deacetylase family protein [Nocardiopsis sp. NPDC058631]|uniref:polysaccharide deacetylase family protein n=1 Tax=Nocardiopsis sp. NPDC058631 TaxID=3346566 RepID=UPI003646C91A